MAMPVGNAAAVLAGRNAGNPRFRINDIAMRINDIAMDERLAGELRIRMENRDNPALFSEVGTVLVQLGQDEEGLSLITRAMNLDPGDPKWKDALESAKAEPVRRRNLQKLMNGQR